MTSYEGARNGNRGVQDAVLSFGLGNTSLEKITRWLLRHEVRFAVDVRDSFRQEKNKRFLPGKLEEAFKGARVEYIDFSDSLGDRPDYQFHTLSNAFSNALNGIKDLAKKGRVAMFCAEKDFRKCHRKIIASRLSRKSLRVQHSVIDARRRSPSQVTLEEVEREVSHPRRRLFTIGYGKKSMRDFSEKLRACRIERVVDIRLRPVSQYAGYARQDDLDYLLELLGIEYVHVPDLAPDTELLEKYRSDKDWTYYERRFADILKGRPVEEIMERILSHKNNVCLLCSEDFSSKCHRRLVAEYAKKLFPTLEILHITSEGVEKSRLSRNTYLDRDFKKREGDSDRK